MFEGPRRIFSIWCQKQPIIFKQRDGAVEPLLLSALLYYKLISNYINHRGGAPEPIF